MLCKFGPFSLQHSETYDVSHAFLRLTVAEISTLKQVRFFGPPCSCSIVAIRWYNSETMCYHFLNIWDVVNVKCIWLVVCGRPGGVSKIDMSDESEHALSKTDVTLTFAVEVRLLACIYSFISPPHNSKCKCVGVPWGPWSDADPPFLSPEPDTSLHCQTTGTRRVL